MTTTRQLGFSNGRVGKALYARVDQNFYALGLRDLRNCIIERAGPATSRSGTIFTGQTVGITRLIPFIFSPDPDQAYALAFSDRLMRVVRNGALVTEASKAITGVTKANPCTLTVVGHGYSTGDYVIVTTGSVRGMTELNGRQYKIIVTGADSFTLKTVSGVNINSTAFTTYVAGGTVARVYSITTPYVEADLFRLGYTQSADVVTIVNPKYTPEELARSGHAAWALSAISFNPDTARPLGFGVSTGTGSSNEYTYKLTAVDQATGEESLPALVNRNISAITQANPGKVTTSSAHRLHTGDQVTLDQVVGMTQVNGVKYTVIVTSATQFTIGVDTTGYTAYGSGGKAITDFIRTVDTAPAASPAAPVLLGWTLATNIIYRVYKYVDGAYALLGLSTSASFNDVDTDVDKSKTPPIERNPFDVAGNWPGAVAMFQQRRFFARSDNLPENIFGSQSGAYKNFGIHSPGIDSDAINARLAGNQVNEIRHMLDLQKLIILTSGAEMVANGDSSGTLTPIQVNTKTYSYHGSSYIRPVVVDNVIVFVQRGGAQIIGMTFDEFGRHESVDLSLPSDLLDGHTVVDMAYQKNPDSVIWFVRDDGVLLSFTFVPEQGIKGWARHDTDGLVESVCCIPGATQDDLYLVIQRDLPSDEGLRYIEKLAPTRFDDIKDYRGMDASAGYDGRRTEDDVLLVFSPSQTPYDQSHSLNLISYLSNYSSTIANFSVYDVGKTIFLYAADGTLCRFLVEGYTNAHQVSGHVETDVPEGLAPLGLTVNGYGTTNWKRATTRIDELWHLEGKTVGVLKDGDVYASPNNSDYDDTTVVVTNGAIDLATAGGTVWVGLPYLPDVETLDIDTVQGEPLIGKKKLIKSLFVSIKDTRGVWAGPNPPSDDDVDPQEGLDSFAPADVDDPENEPIPLRTDVIRIRLQSRWNSNGRIFIRQVDPLPMSILAIAPSGVIPARG